MVVMVQYRYIKQLTLQQDSIEFDGACDWLFQSVSTFNESDNVSCIFVTIRSSSKCEDLPNSHRIAPDIRFVRVDLLSQTFRSHPSYRHLLRSRRKVSNTATRINIMLIYTTARLDYTRTLPPWALYSE